MDMQVPPPVGPNGPQKASSSTPSTQGLSPLNAVPQFLSTVTVNPNLKKYAEKLAVSLMAMAKLAKKVKAKE